MAWFWAASILCAFLALLHVMLFPLLSISTGEFKPRGTYFEENSLLPSLASSTYSQPTIETIPVTPSQLCQFIESEGLPCYRHESSMIWSVINPYFIDEDKEVLVLVALSQNSCDLASYLLTLLKHIRQEKWLTKTVVLLVPIQNQLKCGKSNNTVALVDSWIDMFEGKSGGVCRSSSPVSGVIRAGLVVDIDKASINGLFDINLNLVGSKGRLPNMDLPNLVSNSFKNMISVERGSLKYLSSSYMVLWLGMIDMMFSLLRSPSSVHGSFLQQGIDAVTIELVDQSSSRSGGYNGRSRRGGVSLELVMMNLESVLRSLNMAEQKLTHGFFLYTLMTAPYFASIGEFSITVALIMASYAVLALGAFPHIKTFPPSLLLFTTAYITSMTCQAWHMFELLPTTGLSVVLMSAMAFAVSLVVQSPCQHSTLFVNAVVLGCVNVTAVFQNISLALATPLGLLCCIGLSMGSDEEQPSKTMYSLLVCVWLLIAAVLCVLLSSQDFVAGHDVFVICESCLVSTIITVISPSKRSAL